MIDIPKIYAPYASNFKWVKGLGFQIIDYVTLTIGGSQIDKQYGEWMYIWNEMTLSDEKKFTLKEITDVVQIPLQNTTTLSDKKLYLHKTRLYIPLNFWFCQNPGLALPLISLQREEVYVNFEFTPINTWFTMGSENWSPQQFFFIGNSGGLSSYSQDEQDFWAVIKDKYTYDNIFLYFLSKRRIQFLE